MTSKPATLTEAHRRILAELVENAYPEINVSMLARVADVSRSQLRGFLYDGNNASLAFIDRVHAGLAKLKKSDDRARIIDRMLQNPARKRRTRR